MQIRHWENLGVQRLMLHVFDPQDVHALELLGRRVLPAVQ